MEINHSTHSHSSGIDLPEVKTIEYNCNEDHRVLFHKCKGKVFKEKAQNFFIMKDFDALELMIWLKSFYTTLSTSPQHKDWHNIPKYLMEDNPYSTLVLAIANTKSLTLEERFTAAVFVDKMIAEVPLLSLKWDSAYNHYQKDTKVAVLLLSPFLTFAEKIQTAMQLVEKNANIYTRILIEGSTTFQDTAVFLDNYEDLYAAIIADYLKDDKKITIAPLNLETFIKQNEVLDPFQKVEIISTYIHKFMNFNDEEMRQKHIRNLAAKLFEVGSSMTLNEVLRYEYWIPLFGVSNYFLILKKNAKKQGNPVSRYRSKVLKFIQEKEFEFTDDLGGVVTKMYKKFYSERGTYSE